MTTDGRGHPSPFLILGAVSACAALVAAAGSGSAERLGTGRSAVDPKPAERLDGTMQDEFPTAAIVGLAEARAALPGLDG